MMYVGQVMMLYTLNLYSAVCQLYLSELEKKGKTKRNLLNHSAGSSQGGSKPLSLMGCD